jgi:hypothetical protein
LACRNSLNRRPHARPGPRGGPDVVALLRQAIDRLLHRKRRRSWRADSGGTHLGRLVLLRNAPGRTGTEHRR